MHFANRNLEKNANLYCEGTQTSDASLLLNTVNEVFTWREVADVLLSGEGKWPVGHKSGCAKCCSTKVSDAISRRRVEGGGGGIFIISDVCVLYLGIRT
jgi:hypothetical protein